MSQHHQIAYFELPSSDLTAAKTFYSAAFGWTFTDYGPVYTGFGYPGAGREAGGMTIDRDHTSAPLAILYSETWKRPSKTLRPRVEESSNRFLKLS
jgi:predicted enzyme related to lactoylglutathione lyase